jgi:phosphotransferase system, enzyme I, PtsP
VRPSVHGVGNPALDAIVEMADVADSVAPRDAVLQRLARLGAVALGVEVCSIYVRERGDVLVLRANHGFPADVVGHVRLAVGEGLTGLAVEFLKPVSVRRVHGDPRSRSFPDTGEERFPVFLAVPMLRHGACVGALVAQRRGTRIFTEGEVALATALGAMVAQPLEPRPHADAADEARAGRRVMPLRRTVRLRGVALAPGVAIGRIVVQPQLAAAPAPVVGSDPAAAIGAALAQVALELAELRARVSRKPRAAAFLATALAVVEDTRVMERLAQLVKRGLEPRAAVERLAREYARVAERSPEEFMRRRGVEIEAVLARVLERLEHDLPGTAAPGGVLAADRLDAVTTIEHCAAHGVGICAADGDPSPILGELCAALGLPLVAGVRRLFEWASEGTLAVVDGDTGQVILHPPRDELARYRRQRRGGRAAR